MAESPTPETGTPESQSPSRTPPALITTEELLQSIVTKIPEVPSSSFHPHFPSVSRRAPMERYELLRAADAGHRLQGLRLPPEKELRSAALGGRPAVGPPPRLPHQLSGLLQSVLLGWRSLYESCRTTPKLQALVGECYAQEAVFEDAIVSARGQEAVYRQFAMLGAAVRSVQVSAYSLSVAPLSRPVVLLEISPPPSPGTGTGAPPLPIGATALRPPLAQRPTFQPQAQQVPPARQVGLQALRGLSEQMQMQQQQQPARGQLPQQPPQQQGFLSQRERRVEAPTGQAQLQQMYLTRVTVENVQCFELGLPPFLTWLVGSKARGLQIHLYVTSILLVASDIPLAVSDGSGGFMYGEWLADVTASRLAGAAAVLGPGISATAITPAALYHPGAAAATAGIQGSQTSPCWRIIHQVDIWHNVPMIWWRLRRALCVAMDTLLGPLLRV